jgi:hypothetical protein
VSQIATIESRIDRQTAGTLSISNDAGGMQFESMIQVMEFAKMMAVSSIAVPPHLRGEPGACLAVAIQAVEWRMSPFAVANKSYSVNNRLAYESQLVQAVILQRAPIKGRFIIEYEGEGAKRRCRVSVETKDGQTVEYLSPEVGSIPTKNSPLWKSDPDQQLFYYSGRALCRRHFPDVLLGVYTSDEMENEPRDVTPNGTGLASRVGAPREASGFNAAGVADALADPSTQTDQTNSSDGSEKLDPSFVDWNNADEVNIALDQGVLPAGFSVNADGALVIPAELAGKSGQPRGHSIIAARYREIVTTEGVVVKSPAPEQPDPDVIRDAASAAIAGGDRVAPDDLSPAQTEFWLVEFDRATKEAEAS